jgi:hypothetical protein
MSRREGGMSRGEGGGRRKEEGRGRGGRRKEGGEGGRRVPCCFTVAVLNTTFEHPSRMETDQAGRL